MRASSQRRYHRRGVFAEILGLYSPLRKSPEDPVSTCQEEGSNRDQFRPAPKPLSITTNQKRRFRSPSISREASKTLDLAMDSFPSRQNNNQSESHHFPPRSAARFSLFGQPMATTIAERTKAPMTELCQRNLVGRTRSAPELIPRPRPRPIHPAKPTDDPLLLPLRLQAPASRWLPPANTAPIRPSFLPRMSKSSPDNYSTPGFKKRNG